MRLAQSKVLRHLAGLRDCQGLAVVAVGEGREARRGETCCPPIHVDDHDGQDDDAVRVGDGCGCAAGCTGSCSAGDAR